MVGTFCGCIGSVWALPSLQLGPDPTSLSDWTYNNSDDTWVVSGVSSFDVYAYANCASGAPGCTSPNGQFAWDSDGAAARYAYLVIAAVPDVGNVDGFDVSVTGASMVDSGYGNPPIEDPNSISPHGIFDTWFEIYEFQFDGAIASIGNTQPGDSGTGSGYADAIGITVNSLLTGVTGVHFDLFTVQGARYDPSVGEENKKLVKAVAPYSHDAEWTEVVEVPEPSLVWLLSGGLLGFLGTRKKRTQ